MTLASELRSTSLLHNGTLVNKYKIERKLKEAAGRGLYQLTLFLGNYLTGEENKYTYDALFSKAQSLVAWAKYEGLRTSIYSKKMESTDKVEQMMITFSW